MTIGDIMQKIIEIGEKKGYITTVDLNSLYSAPKRSQHNLVEVRMNKLVMIGYFEKPVYHSTGLLWKRTNKKYSKEPIKEKEDFLIGVCTYCDKEIRSGDRFIPKAQGIFHSKCLKKAKEERWFDD